MRGGGIPGGAQRPLCWRLCDGCVSLGLPLRPAAQSEPWKRGVASGPGASVGIRTFRSCPPAELQDPGRGMTPRGACSLTYKRVSAEQLERASNAVAEDSLTGPRPLNPEHVPGTEALPGAFRDAFEVGGGGEGKAEQLRPPESPL